MDVGINFPWKAYGRDIGPQLQTAKPSGPPPANPLFAAGAPGYKTCLDQLFASYKGLGITCVRWFILADGTNLDPPVLQKGKWQVCQSSLSGTAYTQDFEQILQAAVRQKMLLIPVFVDFLLFAPPSIMINHLGTLNGQCTISTNDVPIPPGTTTVDQFVTVFYKNPVQTPYQDDSQSIDWHRFIKGGRAPILQKKDQIRRFLAAALQPLLDVARSKVEYKNQILAWDLINEPECAIGNWVNGKKQAWDPVQGSMMLYFIGAGVKMILGAGFPATVGFQTAMPLGQDDGYQSKYGKSLTGLEVAKLQPLVMALLALPDFYPQCHFYPGLSGQSKIVQASNFGASTGAKTILGEFATAIDPMVASPWGAVITPPDSILQRISLVEDAGYDWALGWSATLCDENSRFRPSEQAEYKQFTQSGL